MERLWGYVSGREKFGEKEFESLLLDLPEMISVGPPDPIRTEVLGLMFRSLPEMPLYQAEFLSEVCLAKLSVIYTLNGEFFRHIALASPKMGLKIFEHYPTDASAVIREKLLRLVTDEVHRDKLIARLEPTVVDVFRSGDQGKLRDLFESEIHLHVCTARVIASALDHFESLEGDLSAQRRFFPRLDGMLWQTPADNDLLSAIPGIEAKLFEMLSRVQEYGLKGGGLVTALVHLSLNGQIDGLDEKLRARICDAESDEDTLDLCLYGLSRLPVTQANFECVLSHAKLWRDQGRLDLVSSAANSLQFQSGTVPVWTDLGDVKGRLFDLLTVADDDTQFLVGKALVKLDDSGHIQGLRHDLHLRLVDPNQSNQAKVVDLSILNALPVDSDTLNVLVELLECLSEDDTSKLAHEVFSGVGKMIGQAPRGLDVREPQRRWLERGCTILKESAAESDQFKFTRHTLLERSKTCKEAQDASLILVGAIEALKPKGSLEIMELLCRSDFLKKADITPDLMGCYVDLIAECVRAPLHSDAAPDRSILLRSEFDNRLANVLKSDIFESLLKLGKGSTEMKEVLEQKCAAIETALARERQQGEGVESERITILQDLHRGLSSFLTWRKTLER
jgi:hypothetical protein